MSRTRAVLLLVVATVGALRPVVWRASRVVSRTLAESPGRSPADHFARPETPADVLRLNPGIASAEKFEDLNATTSLWKGRTAPMVFGSGVEVTSVMTFQVNFDPALQKMRLDVLETETECTGPAIFKGFIDALLPKIVSSTSIRQEGGVITSDAYMELELPLPAWLPLPRRLIENAGPPILEKQLGNDLGALLEAYAADYAEAAAVDRAAAPEPAGAPVR
ncbi:hypothetical protein M885DRAFT_521017 [Pelagophyceae sp. CCMP2097]|nr:hypothetical protein M885DRAFT_521017 [Pelagophyceae sp. CCMP2097]